MSEFLFRLGDDLADPAQKLLQLRLLMQAVVAIGFAVRDGLWDARWNHPPQYWSLVSEPRLRRILARDAWTSAGKVLLTVLAIDLACQAIVLDFGALALGLAAAVLAALPLYATLRGGLTWLALRRSRGLLP